MTRKENKIIHLFPYVHKVAAGRHRYKLTINQSFITAINRHTNLSAVDEELQHNR